MKLKDVISTADMERCGERTLPVLSMTMHDGIVLQADRFKKAIASKDLSSYKVVRRNQLVVSFPIDEGVLYIQDLVDAGIVSPAYAIWDIHANMVYPRYLGMFLRSPRSIQYYKSKLRGSTARRRTIPREDFLCMELPEVSIAEQRKICTTLEKIKIVISECEQQINRLGEIVKSRFVEMFGDPVINDRQFPVMKFSEIASSRLGKMLDKKNQTGKCAFPYLANYNVQWFRFDLSSLNTMDFTEADRQEFELRKGDLLVCEGGEVGRCAIWNNELEHCYFQKALHRVRCDTSVILPEYLAFTFLLHSKYNGFEDAISGVSTIAHLPGDRLKKLQVIVPPLPLQQKFAAFVHQVDAAKAAARGEIAAMETLRGKMMQEFFG